MKLSIYSRPFQLTAGMENHIREKLEKVLSKVPHPTEVAVTFSDINGTRGGEDKQCKLQFSLPGLGRFVVKDTKADLYQAIDSSAKRAKYAISRAMNRRQKRVRIKDLPEHKSATLEDDTWVSGGAPWSETPPFGKSFEMPRLS